MTYSLKSYLFVLAILLNFNLSFSYEVAEAPPQEERPIVVLVTSYNNMSWVDRNLDSIFQQHYSNYRVIYVDDCSSDGTPDRVEELVINAGKSNQFTLIRNQERKLALSNIYHAVCSCADNEIIVSLDGDDWFYNSQALALVNTAYSQGNVWLTHGRFTEYSVGWNHWSIPIPEEIIGGNAFREFRCPSHLRTFYVWLFKKIKPEDLMYEGNFFAMTWDQAIMFPMIEMAGERHAFIEDFTYVYNTDTPISDNKVDPQLQRDLEAYIRGMPRYQRLDDGIDKN